MLENWLLGSICLGVSGLFLLMAKACCNMTRTDQKENIIASNLLSLESYSVVADIYLIAGVAKSWSNPDMKWYQASDPHFGTPGFLRFQQQVRHSQFMVDLKKMETSWHELVDFGHKF
jgi:hypothetical protein